MNDHLKCEDSPTLEWCRQTLIVYLVLGVLKGLLNPGDALKKRFRSPEDTAEISINSQSHFLNQIVVLLLK